MEKPISYVDPIVDIRYLNQPSSAPLNVDVLLRDNPLSRMVKDSVIDHLSKFKLETNALKNIYFDSLTSEYLFYRIYNDIKDDYPFFVNFHEYLPRYNELENRYKDANLNTLSLEPKVSILFIYVFNAYNKDLGKLGRTLEFLNKFNNSASATADQELPYMQGFVAIYNIENQRLEYYKEIFRLIDLKNEKQSMSLLLKEITDALPDGYAKVR